MTTWVEGDAAGPEKYGLPHTALAEVWREAPPHQPPSLAAAALEIFCSFTATQGLPGLLVFFPWCIFFNCILALMLQMSAKPFSGFVYLSFDFEPILTNSCRNCHGSILFSWAPLR